MIIIIACSILVLLIVDWVLHTNANDYQAFTNGLAEDVTADLDE